MSDDILLKDEFEVAEQVTSAKTLDDRLNAVITGVEGVEQPAPDFESGGGGSFVQETMATAHPHVGRTAGISNIGEMPGRWTYEAINEPSFAQQYSDAGHYPDTSVMHPEFNPMLRAHRGTLANGERVNIPPAFIRKVRSFYGSGKSKLDAEKEMAWVQYHMTSGTGGRHNAILNPANMGFLQSEHTSHALYENHYQDWLDLPLNEQGDTLYDWMQGLVQQGESEEAIDRLLRKKHLDEMEDKWRNDPDWKLGEYDYLHGMEWLTHAEREEVYRHMDEHGTDNRTQQAIPSLDMKFSIPRAKYSRVQRESGYHRHFVRSPTSTGNPIQAPMIKDSSPKDSRPYFYHRLESGMGRSFYADMMTYHREHTERERKRRKEYKGQKAPQYGYDFLQIDRDKDGNKTYRMKPLSSKHFVPNKKTGKVAPRGVGREQLMLTAGVRYNKRTDDYEFIPKGEHPFFQDWDPNDEMVTWTPQDIKDFLNITDDERNMFKLQNDVSNAAQFHTSHSVVAEGEGAHPEAYTKGHHDTLASHWSFNGEGGHGKTYTTVHDMRHSAFQSPTGQTIHTEGPMTVDTKFIEAEQESPEDKLARLRRHSEAGGKGDPTTVPMRGDLGSEEDAVAQRQAINLMRRGELGTVVPREGSEGLTAAFGEPRVNATLEGGVYTVRDSTDIRVGMSPHAVSTRRRFAGNTADSRNRDSWAGPYHNEQYRYYHELLANGLDNEAQEHKQQHISHAKTGPSKTLVDSHNPFAHLNNTNVDLITARLHHIIPTLAGFTAPPGNPQSGIHHPKEIPDNAHHTTTGLADFNRLIRGPTEEDALFQQGAEGGGGPSPLRDSGLLPESIEDIEHDILVAQQEISKLEGYLRNVANAKMDDEKKEKASNNIKAAIKAQEDLLYGSLIDSEELPEFAEPGMRSGGLIAQRDALAEELQFEDAPHRERVMQIEEELEHAHEDYLETKEALDELLAYKEENNDTSAHHQEKIDAKVEALKEYSAHIHELESELDQHYVAPEDKKLRNAHYDNFKKLLEDHNFVVQQGAQKFIEEAYKQGFDPFAEMTPDTVVALAMMYGNIIANNAPNSYHKLEALQPTYEEDVVPLGAQGKSLGVASLAVKKLAGQLTSNNNKGSAPLSLSQNVEDWLEALGMQNVERDDSRPEMGTVVRGRTNIARDSAVQRLRAVYKKLKDQFGEDQSFYVLPVEEFLQGGLGEHLSEYDLQGMGDIHSHLTDDLSYYLDETGEKKKKFRAQNTTAPRSQVMLHDIHRGEPQKYDTHVMLSQHGLKPSQQSQLSPEERESLVAGDPMRRRHQRRAKIFSALQEVKNTLGHRSRASANGMLLADDDFLADNKAIQPRRIKGKKIADKEDNKAEKRIGILDSFIILLPEHEPKIMQNIVEKVKELKPKKIGGGAGTHENYGIQSLYDSPAYRMEWGTVHDVTLGMYLDESGKPVVYRLDEPEPLSLVTPTLENAHALAPMHRNYFGDHRSDVPIERQPRGKRKNLLGRSRNEEVTAPTNKMDGPSLLASLTNPDYIRKDMPDGVPSLQAMHRIFELDDMEYLKGFTGDWIVSDFPEGPRFFVTKKNDKVESKADLSDEEKEAFKKVSEKDFVIDAIRGKDVIHIFDILEFDGNDTYDMPIQERIKIMRGALESVEMVHTPSASDTKLTDDAGLKSAVKNLEGPRILMRDAKSAYMKGEPRHPKWVMLQPGSEVVLMVLDRRGDGPYHYRLGTGPIAHGEDLGDRKVEHEGNDYMDVGASFQSEDKYDVGDLVRVDVTNVTETEASERQKVYTVHAPKIEGEAEGEGLVSSESLSMLAKGELYHHPVEVFRKGRYVQIKIGDDAVIYKASMRDDEWSVHTPQADNPYVLRLSESQRPFWSPVVGVLLKGELEIEEKSEVKESVEPAKPLTQPHKVKDTEWKQKKQHLLSKSLILLERLLEKSSVGAVGDYHGGAKGLGFDYGTPIESPSGPTNLNDAKTMPDYDVRDIERENKERAEDKRKPKESGALQGNLELTDEKAVIHTD